MACESGGTVTEESVPAKILIVEDEALIAREIQHRLTNMGWEVVGAAFGEEAVELAIKTQPDLLLSDIHLRHGLSGIDLARRIQAVMDVPVDYIAFDDEGHGFSKRVNEIATGHAIISFLDRELKGKSIDQKAKIGRAHV